MIAVRLRFTALNAVLFLMPGIGLLALITLLAGTRASAPVAGQVPAQPSLAGAHKRIRLLEAQLTDIRTAQSRQLIAGSPSAPAKPEQVAKLAQSFQRLAADRTGTRSGLGLSIVAATVEAHGDLRVTISLPS
ncbi:sensor histidine kinase [Allorhizocola rhizosphaerae]|uniref:sensor histidine kinase n=1 Tax=Allorhizocola rhizosphaerae TaxID=1872709 RepID=UPI0013C2FF67|nr:sensor histidine kinase [Allorhizocola rhizosphaerae]